MRNLQKEYNNIMEQKIQTMKEIKSLEENEIVKKYLQLQKQNESLYNQQLNLYKDLKMEEYASCNHILVYSQVDRDEYDGHKYLNCGCIKCGLDNSVLNGPRDWLSETRKIMYDYLKKNYHSGNFRGIQTEVVCDIDLAEAIYAKIKSAHPDIDDETAIKYFEIALENIRNIKVSDERKANRAKRLSLDCNFKKWNSTDI